VDIGFIPTATPACCFADRIESGSQRLKRVPAGEAGKVFREETLYLPLHHQTLAYAMKNGFDIPVDVSNQPKLKYLSFKTN